MREIVHNRNSALKDLPDNCDEPCHSAYGVTSRGSPHGLNHPEPFPVRAPYLNACCIDPFESFGLEPGNSRILAEALCKRQAHRMLDNSSRDEERKLAAFYEISQQQRVFRTLNRWVEEVRSWIDRSALDGEP